MKLIQDCNICSPQTYSKIKNNCPIELGELTQDYHCPNWVKLKGRGQKKLYAIVYQIKGNLINSILFEGIYNWKLKPPK